MGKLIICVCRTCLNREKINLQTFDLWDKEYKDELNEKGHINAAYRCDKCKTGSVSLVAAKGQNNENIL